MAGWIRALSTYKPPETVSTYKPPETVIGVVERLVDIGVDEVSVSDTIGTASAVVGVDLEKLSQARRLLDPFLVDDRRSLPKDGSPACAACEFSTDNFCCRRG